MDLPGFDRYSRLHLFSVMKIHVRRLPGEFLSTRLENEFL